MLVNQVWFDNESRSSLSKVLWRNGENWLEPQGRSDGNLAPSPRKCMNMRLHGTSRNSAEAETREAPAPQLLEDYPYRSLPFLSSRFNIFETRLPTLPRAWRPFEALNLQPCSFDASPEELRDRAQLPLAEVQEKLRRPAHGTRSSFRGFARSGFRWLTSFVTALLPQTEAFLLSVTSTRLASDCRFQASLFDVTTGLGQSQARRRLEGICLWPSC